MELVVKQRALFLRAFDRLELSPAGCIPHCNFGVLVEAVRCVVANLNPRLHHDLVDYLWVCFHLEITLLIDGAES